MKLNKVNVSLLCLCLMMSFVFVNFGVNSSLGQLTTIYIDPTPVTAYVCNNFTVAVNVRDVTDLYAWQLNLSFNPYLLECLNVTEGPFLSSVGPTIFPPPIINNTVGTILAGCSRMMPPGASGSGTLAYIEFHCKGPGECDLVFLYPDTFLVDSFWITIPHSALNGHVIQEATPVGGVWIPVGKLGLLAPYIALVSTIISTVVVTAVLFRRKKKQ